LDELTWQEFQDFVKYVFECAGYLVVNVASRPKLSVDLHLFVGKAEGPPAAYVEVRHYRKNRISRPG
jgi:hypothetical protein